MVCSIAENKPLQRLKVDLGLPFQCHSFRQECIHGLASPHGDYALGIPGAALGYCQALFNRSSHTMRHTEKVKKLLRDIAAPWANSHELFWGYRHQQESAEEYIQSGLSPLVGNGRVPILITSLDPARDRSEIESILSSEPKVAPNETILVRFVLGSDKSLRKAAQLIRGMVNEAFACSRMPKWWPLLQGELTVDQWQFFKMLLGESWRFANIAVNPFVADDVFEYTREQVTVAQVVVGLADGITSDGTVKLAPGMRISGAQDGDRYSMYDYMNKLSGLSVCPTLIVLGPALPGWTDETNQKRVRALLPVLQKGCNILWSRLELPRRNFIWELAA